MRQNRRERERGQSVVELALVVPILLLLLLITIDFGRVFMGWVELNSMARVAANYSAQHKDAWPPLTSRQLAERAEYEALIDASKGVIDCTPVKPGNHYPEPTFAGDGAPGDLATVTLQCNFTLFAPFVRNLFQTLSS